MEYNMRHLSFLLFLSIQLICSQYSDAQELPPIHVYSPDQYGGENQNWSISQSSNDKIYIANNKGLLEFDGANWLLYNTPNNTIIRSVTVVGAKIYTGCYMEFGFWQEDNYGQLQYTSLSKSIDQPLIEDEQFWNIIHIDEYILFQSLDRIYIFNTKDNSFNVVGNDETIIKTYKVSDGIYFQTISGIYKIEDGKPKLVTNDPFLRDNIIVNMFEKQGTMLLLSQNNGFYELNNNKLTRWSNPNNELPSNLSIYSAIQLKNGNFAIGTISNGFIQLNNKGEIIYQIDSSNGLSNNTVLSLFEDSTSNIWLALDNGVNSINIHSPFKIFNDNKGALGTVYASAVYRDKLYLGTNQGLFFKPFNSPDDFTFIKETQGQVWSLDVINDALFCGHNLGTYIINDDTATKISSIQGTWSIKPIKGRTDILLQGNYNGLNILEKKGTTWSFKNKIENFNISSRYFELHNTNEIFVNHEYKGLFRISIDSDFSEAISIDKMNVSQESKSGIVLYNNQLFYANQEGVYKYDTSSKEFTKDTIYSTFYAAEDYVSGVMINDDLHNRLWGFSKENICYATPGTLSNVPVINKFPLPLEIRKNIAGYENLLEINDEEYLIGTSNGYIIMDVNKFEQKNYDISINTITSNNLNATKQNLLDKEVPASLENKENEIGFTYSVTEFDKHIRTKYQYQLIGVYDKWSSWTETSNVLFKNLAHGDYTFNVRGSTGESALTNTASYSFTIEKPWYLSNWMIAIYALSIILVSFRIHTFYKRYYKRKEIALLSQTKKELDLAELENQKQLISLENQKLQQDIENKNRELAISTMSIIKKNEFLSTLKKELNNNSEDDLKRLIKIIDKNLNNTDDWKLFEEAFNNADKDFLKKMKAKHAVLTPNDLRLCAYLRLNLSSKEIAPLLNISPRSVEVKRYRLRKKMELPHESSLTNYILEI